MRLLLLFLLFPLFVQAQQIRQLTKNNIHDDEIDIYKNRVVWHSGNISDIKNEYIEIFFAEGNKIQQITSGKLINDVPKVGSKYIVWRQLERNTNRSFLMCYDGNKTICLDTIQGRFEYNTVTDYVLWYVPQGNNTYKYYFYNGENILPFVDAEGKSASGGRLTEDGIFYTYRHGNINYLALYNNARHEIIDSCQHCNIAYRPNLDISWTMLKDSKQSGKTISYNLYDSSKTNFQQIFLVNGVKYILKDFDDSLNIDYASPSYTGRDFQVYSTQDKNGQHGINEIIVWRNGKYYNVSAYPFDKITIHEELNDITFPFQYFDNKERKIGIFSRNKIYIPASGIFNGEAISYGNTVVWSSSADIKNYETSEVYYFCDEDSCITANPTENFSAKIFHRDNAKQIAIEIETPQAEDFVATVYDLLGRELVTAKFQALYGKIIYPVSSALFTQGIYLVHLQSTQNVAHHKTQKLFIPK